MLLVVVKTVDAMVVVVVVGVDAVTRAACGIRLGRMVTGGAVAPGVDGVGVGVGTLDVREVADESDPLRPEWLSFRSVVKIDGRHFAVESAGFGCGGTKVAPRPVSSDAGIARCGMWSP